VEAFTRGTALILIQKGNAVTLFKNEIFPAIPLMIWEARHSEKQKKGRRLSPSPAKHHKNQPLPTSSFLKC